MNRHHVSNILYCVGSSLGIQPLNDFVRTQVEIGRAREREYDRSRLQASTRSMLKRIIAHANETVPFYQALWKEKGVNISKITAAGDLPSLPLVAKADLQRNPRRALLSKESRRTSLRSTSGTTAAPRLVFRDETARIYWSTAVRRYLAEYEVPTGGTVLLTHSQALTPIRYQAGANENWIRWVWVSVSDLIETPGLAARLNADAVLGSPQQLEAIAQLAYSTGDIRPPKVFVSFAERLDPASRRRIERATGANVFDMYCTTELSVPIAFECRGHTGLHTNSDYVIVEVVNSAGDPVGPGEQGEVVVTDLCNFVSPVIRYRLGDIATKTVSSTCSCGRALPLQILRIDGRVTDQIFLSNGRVMNALPLVDELQATTACPLTLIQETHDSFTLKCYYTAAKRSAVPRDRIEQIVRHYLGPETNLQICIDELSATLHNESGKVRSFFSRIPKDENVVPVLTFTRSR